MSNSKSMDLFPTEILFAILGYLDDRNVRLVSRQWKYGFDYVHQLNGDQASLQWYLAENMVAKKQDDLFHLKNINAYILPIDHNKYIPVLPKFSSYYFPSFESENYCTFEKIPGTELEVLDNLVIPDIIMGRYCLDTLLCCICLARSPHYYFVEYQKAYKQNIKYMKQKAHNQHLKRLNREYGYYSSDSMDTSDSMDDFWNEYSD